MKKGVIFCGFILIFVILSFNALAVDGDSKCGSLSQGEYCLYDSDYDSMYGVSGYINYVDVGDKRVEFICNYEGQNCKVDVNGNVIDLVLGESYLDGVNVYVHNKKRYKDDDLKVWVVRFRVDVNEGICNENWKCDEWSECFDGGMERECEDVNNCGTFEDMPELEKNCGIEGVCGDGVLNEDEECDDGGLVDGDGCDGGCVIEMPVDLFVSYHKSDGVVGLEWKHYSGLFENGNDVTGNVVLNRIMGKDEIVLGSVVNGDGLVLNRITGGAVFNFDKIVNFFKWLFGARVVGVQIGSDGYVVYRREELQNNFDKIGFVDGCNGNKCDYEDVLDFGDIDEGVYHYGVSVVFNGVESEIATFSSVLIEKPVVGLSISPKGRKSIKVGDEIQFNALGGLDILDGVEEFSYVWSVEGDCGEVKGEIGDVVDGAGEFTNGIFLAIRVGECYVVVSSGDEVVKSGLIKVKAYGGENEYSPKLNYPIGIGNKIVEAGKQLKFNFNGKDDDGNKLFYNIQNLDFGNWNVLEMPTGAELKDEGKFEWDTLVSDKGVYLFNFSVNDGKYLDNEIVVVNVYESGIDKCYYNKENIYAPKGACFEKKPIYCDSELQIRYNCSDCGCPKFQNQVCVFEKGQYKCVEPYDCVDNDGDGSYGVSANCPEMLSLDCDDNDANINIMATEICGDNKDNNCDGNVDEEGCIGGVRE